MNTAKQLAGLAGWVLACFTAAAIGGLFRPGSWYTALRKPPWNPPSWLFGPVWMALYLMMAIAAWLIWRRGGFSRQRRPLGLFIAQLALNALWSPLFFGLKRPGLAFAEILILWGMIGATLYSFRKENLGAAALLLPYLGWVTFAAALNFTIWRLN